MRGSYLFIAVIQVYKVNNGNGLAVLITRRNNTGWMIIHLGFLTSEYKTRSSLTDFGTQWLLRHGIIINHIGLKCMFAIQLKYIQISCLCISKEFASTQLILWLMERGGSMPHSQGLSGNLYSESNQHNSSY